MAQGQELELRAYKYAVDVAPGQAAVLRRYCGAARMTYNAYVAEMRARRQRWERAREGVLRAGVEDPAAVKTAMRAAVEAAPADAPIGAVSSYSFQKEWLTPTVAGHREAANRIAGGEDPDLAMEGLGYSQPWLHQIPRRVLVSGIANAGKAWSGWMSSVTGQRSGRKVGFPRFKAKAGSRDSFTIPAPEKMGARGTQWGKGAQQQAITDYRHVYAAYLGCLRTHQNTRRMVRALDRGAEIRSYTISRNADRWYISFLLACPAANPAPSKAQQRTGTVGVDLGVKSLAALSTGEIIENPRPGRRTARQVKTLQRKIARAQKGSNRRRRLVQQLARAQHRAAQQRRTHTDRLTKHLTTTYAAIGIEDLNVSGMTSSAKGTIEAPGRNVRAKAGLNREILDASFGAIRTQLEYKARWYGSDVIVIDRYEPTSKACFSCGTVKPKLSLGERTFTCECGYTADRDINAARNIARVAKNTLACGTRESLNGRGADPAAPEHPVPRVNIDASSPPPPGNGHQVHASAPLPT